MEYTTKTQLILNGLYRDRQELTKQLTDVERLIKKPNSKCMVLH